MQLSPRTQFAIVRQIEDHTDSTTYYVRAVIRNAQTDVLLDTINLTDRGSQRFSKNWLVPADVSGTGFYVSILTSVYTDSGYTTKSQNYADKMETYLVQERYNPNIHMGSVGGGSDINYKTIKKIVEDVIFESKLSTLENVNLSVIESNINNIGNIISSIRDSILSGVDQKISSHATSIVSKIDSIKIPPPEKVEYSFILEPIKKINDSLVKITEDIITATKTDKDEMKSTVMDAVTKTLNNNTNKLNKLKEVKKLYDAAFGEDTDEMGDEDTKENLVKKEDPRIKKIMKKI